MPRSFLPSIILAGLSYPVAALAVFFEIAKTTMDIQYIGQSTFNGHQGLTNAQSEAFLPRRSVSLLTDWPDLSLVVSAPSLGRCSFCYL